jgi:hypothetical protein
MRVATEKTGTALPVINTDDTDLEKGKPTTEAPRHGEQPRFGRPDAHFLD